MGISDCRLAKAIHVPQTRISAIVNGRRRITADTGLRLARYFGVSEGFFTGLQEDYDLALAEDELADALVDTVPTRRDAQRERQVVFAWEVRPTTGAEELLTVSPTRRASRLGVGCCAG